MSLVMGVGNKDFILFAGEQRCINQEGDIVSESYKKVHKINDNVIIGFCGDSTYCEIITKYLFDDTLSKQVKLKVSYEEVLSLIKSQFKSVVEQVEADTKYRKAKAYVIIGGKMDGKLKLSALFYEDKLEINELDLNSVNPNLIVLESGRCDHRSNITKKFNDNPKISIKNLTLIFANAVKEGIEIDHSINDKMNFGLIEK